MIVTPCSTTRSPAARQLAVAAALRGQVDDHRARAPCRSTISRVTSTGDLFPGITAAVMTTSLSATTRPSSSRWRW